jgi:DNA-binding transcriptional LysR family regulator
VFDARRLPTFREVARRGSFAAAADALWLTPSAVSQQMAALEREVGAKLFERNHRGVRLTDAGERLLGHADALLDRLCDRPDGSGRPDAGWWGGIVCGTGCDGPPRSDARQVEAR